MLAGLPEPWPHVKWKQLLSRTAGLASADLRRLQGRRRSPRLWSLSGRSHAHRAASSLTSQVVGVERALGWKFKCWLNEGASPPEHELVTPGPQGPRGASSLGGVWLGGLTPPC